MHLGGRWVGDRGVWADASGTIRGEVAVGPDWSIAGLADRLVIGTPATRSVRLTAVPSDDMLLGQTELGRWERSEQSFGQVVAVAPGGDSTPRELWVGAPEAQTYQGVVFRYPDALASVGQPPALRIVGASAGDRTGTVLAPCGDLTGDQRTDWLITAPRFSQPADGDELPGINDLAGAVFLLESETYLALEGEVALSEVARGWWGTTVGEGVGTAAACSHDLTGDGIGDLAVGAPVRGGARAGRVYILDGASLPDSGPIEDKAWWTLQGADAEAWFGAALATGDFDGDGLFDLVVGEPGANAGAGRALVYRGAPIQQREADIAPHTAFEVIDRDTSDHFGATLAAGTINNDPFWDLAIGAPDWQLDTAFDAGRVFIWEGSAEWAATEVAGTDNERTLTGGQPFQRVGKVMNLIDLDKDGNDDILLTTRDKATP